MSDEMIVRVALVLKAEIGKAFAATPLPGSRPEWGDWSATGGSLNLEVLARAAIEAMREPTDRMLVTTAETNFERGILARVYRKMIDAELTD